MAVPTTPVTPSAVAAAPAASSPATTSAFDAVLVKTNPDGVCSFVNARNLVISSADCEEWVRGKTLALYFSASWCRPCVEFTNILVDYLSRHSDQVVGLLVPFDRSRTEAIKYLSKMPNLLCLEYDPVWLDAIKDSFDVRSIPTLVFINAAGTQHIPAGVDLVTRDEVPWQ